MGRVGDWCYHNSMIEAFWSRMQVELVDRRRWKTRVELPNAIFDDLKIQHNRQRRSPWVVELLRDVVLERHAVGSATHLQGCGARGW
jgi:hypothetical protein